MSPFDEGRAGAERSIPASECPYAFNRSGVSQEIFNRDFRPKMNEWFNGWKSWLDERGLGFNFKPKQEKEKP